MKGKGSTHREHFVSDRVLHAKVGPLSLAAFIFRSKDAKWKKVSHSMSPKVLLSQETSKKFWLMFGRYV